MDDKLISVIDLAAELGRHRAFLFKVIKLLKIKQMKETREGRHRGQSVAYVTQEDAEGIREYVQSRQAPGYNNGTEDGSEGYSPTQKGVFYLLVLEPKHDPGRFKVGFTTNLSERLRTHRCSAPFATVVKSWPCRQLWEKTAIECVSSGCERLHTEVFRTTDLNQALAKCEKFFELMPSLSEEAADVRQ
jgi:hypothetical protein